jgi:hypothetical protein
LAQVKRPVMRVDQRVLVDGELDDVVEVRPRSASSRSSASACALVRGKPSKMKRRSRAGIEALADQRGDDRVADQLARVHDRLDLLADRRAAGARLAQHVAGRQLDHSALRLQPRACVPLPAPGGPNRMMFSIAALSPDRRLSISAAAAWS